jgi:Ca-activated chloride channel homolog
VLARPSDDRAAAVDAIKRLSVSGGTSTGAGMYSALEAIVGEPLDLVDETRGQGTGSGADAPQLDTSSNVDIGYFGASEIVMFSDGENTSGIDPLQVADLLARSGVKVTTVGVGTKAGAVIDVDGYSVSTALDTTQREEIAAATNGDFYEAADAEAFARIAGGLELEWRTEGEPTEITGLLAAIAAGLLIVGAALAAVLLGRMI